ncbi:unnamed protein product, partial [Brachionus calyciflorus]
MLKKRLYICAIDASKAFDKVNRLNLWAKMIQNSLNPAISMAILNYYKDSLMFVKNYNEFSYNFPTTLGIKQGETKEKKTEIDTDSESSESEDEKQENNQESIEESKENLNSEKKDQDEIENSDSESSELNESGPPELDSEQDSNVELFSDSFIDDFKKHVPKWSARIEFQALKE